MCSRAIRTPEVTCSERERGREDRERESEREREREGGREGGREREIEREGGREGERMQRGCVRSRSAQHVALRHKAL